ncbi:MAG: HvfC/BufC family peptide modification chaperone [Rhodoferax sp.]
MRLSEQQGALLAVLFDGQPQNAIENIANELMNTRARGIKAYQSNGHALAQRALQAAYPVLLQLLGPESFAELARAYWHAEPPRCGDVGCWGEGLAAWVQDDAQLASAPYLADVARCEWALHRAALAADAAPDAASLALLAQHDADGLGLALGPGAALVRSAWPVATLWAAHQSQPPDLAQARQRLAQGVAEDAVVWRQGWRAQLRLAWPGEAALLQALLAGQTLGAALDQAGDALDVAQWLPMALHSGLVLRAYRLGACADGVEHGSHAPASLSAGAHAVSMPGHDPHV